MRSVKYLWLAVTPDEYELPLAVADSARELAEVYGLTKETVISAVVRKQQGHKQGRRFLKVRNEDEGT